MAVVKQNTYGPRAEPADPQLLALKVPPHSVEAEQSMLGALLLDNQAFDRVADLVTAEDFYRDDHRRIWRHIARLIEHGRPADVVTVSESVEASEEMVSTISSAGWPAASIALRIAGRSLTTPVAVSIWTTKMALIVCLVSILRRASTAEGSTALRPLWASISISAPMSFAISPQPIAKRPLSRTRT